MVEWQADERARLAAVDDVACRGVEAEDARLVGPDDRYRWSIAQLVDSVGIKDSLSRRASAPPMCGQ